MNFLALRVAIVEKTVKRGICEVKKALKHLSKQLTFIIPFFIIIESLSFVASLWTKKQVRYPWLIYSRSGPFAWILPFESSLTNQAYFSV
jgi:hypothetical protein